MGAGLLLLALSSVGVLRPISDLSFIILSPIESAMRSVAQPVADLITNYQDVRDLTKENAALRLDNQRLNAEIARLQEDATQRQELERLLNVKNSLANQQFLGAHIIAHAPGSLRRMVAIDRGQNDGIKVGMPAVTEGNTLVGTVTKVEGNYSWVTLITDVDSAVSGIILETRAQGVVSGGFNGNLSMEFVSQDASVNDGATVLTSGVGGSYPAGLVIGQVTDVTGSPQELFRNVTVEPLASLSDLETVLVMTSFTPTQIANP